MKMKILFKIKHFFQFDIKIFIKSYLRWVPHNKIILLTKFKLEKLNIRNMK
jgi:hypothetical protein